MKQILTVGFITFLIALVESIGLTLLRIGGIQNIIYASLIFGGLVAPLLAYVIPFEVVGLTNFLWNISSTILMFAIGVYYFNEKIKYLQVMGVLISFVGIAMVLTTPD